MNDSNNNPCMIVSSYAGEVIADYTNVWAGNGLRFTTRKEAQEYINELSWRWTAVREVRVVASSDPVTHTFTAGKLQPVKPARSEGDL